MLRGSFLVFIAGWLTWFWMDKPDPQRFGFPQAGDSLVADFQHAFDLLRAGFPDMAFLYLWGAHYILLSLLGGALLAVMYGGVSDMLGRRRMRRLILPTRTNIERNDGDSAGTRPDSTPSGQSDQ